MLPFGIFMNWGCLFFKIYLVNREPSSSAVPQWTNCRPRQKRKDALLDAPLLFFFFKAYSLERRNRGDPHSIPPAFSNESLNFHTGFCCMVLWCCCLLYEPMALRPRILSPFWSCLQWHAAYQGCTDLFNTYTQHTIKPADVCMKCSSFCPYFLPNPF